MTFLIWLAALLSIGAAVHAVRQVTRAWKANAYVPREESPQGKGSEARAEAGKRPEARKNEESGKNPSDEPKSEAASGVVHVLATFKNTIVTVTDDKGAVLGWSSAGKLGIRGSRKSTADAAQLVSQDACRQAKESGLRSVRVVVKGQGPGRDSAVQAATAGGFDVRSIEDVTPQPEEGVAKS